MKSPAQKGDRTTVYFPDGSSSSFIAQNDIISSKVAVMGDRVFSEDVSQSQLTRTTELFRSKQILNPEIDKPWAYLFEINDFEALTSSTGQSINYTDTSWSLDNFQGHYKSQGDGGGDFKTLDELLLDVGDDNLITELRVHENRMELTSDSGFRGIGNSTVTPFATFDGIHSFVIPTRYAENNRLVGNDNKTRPVYLQRQYQISESARSPNFVYNLFWSANGFNINEGDRVQVKFNGFSEIFFIALSIGTDGNTYQYSQRGNGEIKERFEENGRTIVTEEYKTQSRQRRDEILAALNFIPPNLNQDLTSFDGQTLTGEALSNRSFRTNFRHGGNIPESFQADGETYQLATRVSSSILYYSSSVYLIPLQVERDPGVKSIYFQVSEQKKVLLHQIPAYEPWDGYASPLPNGKLEVVLKCAKKFPSNRKLRNYDTTRSGWYSYFVQREWSQVRVYLVSKTGVVEPVKIFNNSKTDLNPTDVADKIEISEDNWQKEWLESYQDWRSPRFNYLPYVRNFIDLIQRLGEPDSLNSAYRTYYSELLSSHIVGLEATDISRSLIVSTGYGTLTESGFVYLDPAQLFDKNIALDYSFSGGTNVFPSPNYSIFSALNSGRTTESVYYKTTGEFDGNTFTDGTSIEKSTIFPKLDLAEELATGVVLPEEITPAQWTVDWSIEPEVKTDLTRFGIKAIVYIER